VHSEIAGQITNLCRVQIPATDIDYLGGSMSWDDIYLMEEGMIVHKSWYLNEGFDRIKAAMCETSTCGGGCEDCLFSERSDMKKFKVWFKKYMERDND